jgi:hypothetical protein
MSHLPNVYAIISTTDIDNVDFTQVPEENNESLRYSLDGTEFVIKWFDEHEPTFITDGTVVPLQTLTHEQALALMATSEWSEPIPVEE